MTRLLTALVLLGTLVPTVASAQYATTKVLTIPAFTNLTKQPAHAWLNEALADMLTTDIAATKKVRVVNRLELKKLLAEQQFAVSDLAEAETRLKLGNMVGASVILTGSYSVMGEKIRIDAKVFDVEKGDSIGAATVEGPLDQVFVLEKKLALKSFEALGVTLADEDKIKLLQIESQNVAAVADNYRGVMAMESKDTKAAQAFFEKAAAADPYYRGAKKNLDGLKMEVRGASLFAGAVDELTKKRKQLEAMTGAIKDFRKELWDVQLDGPPKPVTNGNDPNRVTITQRIKWSMRESALQKLVTTMSAIQAGDVLLCIPSVTFGQKQDNCFKVYKDNYESLAEVLISRDRSYVPTCRTVRILGQDRVLLSAWACLHIEGTSYSDCNYSHRRDEGCRLFADNVNVKFTSANGDNDFVIRFPNVPTSALNDMKGIELVEE